VIGIREEALVEESPARDALETRFVAAEAERDAALLGAAVALLREKAALRRVAELEAMLAAREELGATAAAQALAAMGSGVPPAAGSALARSPNVDTATEAQNVATPIRADAADVSVMSTIEVCEPEPGRAASFCESPGVCGDSSFSADPCEETEADSRELRGVQGGTGRVPKCGIVRTAAAMRPRRSETTGLSTSSIPKRQRQSADFVAGEVTTISDWSQAGLDGRVRVLRAFLDAGEVAEVLKATRDVEVSPMLNSISGDLETSRKNDETRWNGPFKGPFARKLARMVRSPCGHSSACATSPWSFGRGTFPHLPATLASRSSKRIRAARSRKPRARG
jgi:hypothetical protein